MGQLDRFFISAKYEDNAKDKEVGINRHQFFEALIRLADAKYKQ